MPPTAADRRPPTLRLTALLLVAALLLLTGCGPAGLPATGDVAETATSPGYPPPTPAPPTEPSSLSAYPPPPPTLPPSPTTAPAIPTSTIPPVPTSTPRPEVTPVPTSAPPLLQSSGGRTPYALLIREGQELLLLEEGEREPRLVVDVVAATGLHLAERVDGVMPFEWGSAAPDGSQVVLVLSDSESRTGQGHGLAADLTLAILEIESGAIRILDAHGSEPHWSPEGRTIAYRDQQSGALTLLDPASGSSRVLLTPEESEGDFFHVAWSPVGDRLALTSAPGGPAALGAIWILTVAGAEGGVEEVVPREWLAGRPIWSRDGRALAFAADHDPERPGGATEHNLWLVTLESGARSQLTRDYLALDRVDWSADGRWLLLAGANLLEAYPRSPRYDLWLIAADGRETRRLLNDPAIEVEAQWIGERQILLSRSHPEEPAVEIVEFDLATGQSTPLYQRLSEDGGAIEFLTLPR